MKTTQEILKKVLKNANSKKQVDVENAWFYYLQKKLKFSFKAEINLISFSRVFRDCDIVKVKDVTDWVELYGLIMKVKKTGKHLGYPLKNLKC